MSALRLLAPSVTEAPASRNAARDRARQVLSASACHRCGCDLIDETVWWYPIDREGPLGTFERSLPHCEQCVNAWVVERYRGLAKPCEFCGRLFVDRTLGGIGAPRRRTCSPLCSRERRNALRRERRASELRACEGCGEAFAPPRTDAIYCSSACRQRAYRERLSTTEPRGEAGLRKDHDRYANDRA